MIVWSESGDILENKRKELIFMRIVMLGSKMKEIQRVLIK